MKEEKFKEKYEKFLIDLGFKVMYCDKIVHLNMLNLRRISRLIINDYKLSDIQIYLEKGLITFSFEPAEPYNYLFNNENEFDDKLNISIKEYLGLINLLIYDEYINIHSDNISINNKILNI